MSDRHWAAMMLSEHPDVHTAGMPWARIGELVGHDDLMTTARTYTHVVTEGELDYAEMLDR